MSSSLAAQAAQLWAKYSNMPIADDWSALSPAKLDIDAFEWQSGTTPLSHVYYPLGAVAVYYVVIFALQAFMKNRERVNVKWIVFVHNTLLLLWSVVMFLGIVSVALPLGLAKGPYHLLCNPDDSMLAGGRLTFFMYIYYLSKFIELIDTVILVLKKLPLTVLHTFHHGVVVIMVWTWIEWGWGLTFWGAGFNTFVHCFMYYLFARASIASTPYRPWWKKHLTSLQLLQFFSVLILIFVWFYACSTGPFNVVVFSQAVNIIFLVLFTNFYLQTYVWKTRGAAAAGEAGKKKKQ